MLIPWVSFRAPKIHTTTHKKASFSNRVFVSCTVLVMFGFRSGNPHGFSQRAHCDGKATCRCPGEECDVSTADIIQISSLAQKGGY